MKLNSAKEEDCAGHDSDYNGSRKENLDSNSCNNISSHQQIYKSCDTIDQESGLNYGEYYSLHSILSFADQSSSIANGKSNEYSLHATTNNGLMTGKLASYLKSGKSSKNALNNLRYFNRKDLCKIISHYSANDDSIPDMLFEYLQDFLMIKSYLISVSAKAKVQIDDDNEILFSNIDSFFINDFKSINFNMAYKAYCECKVQVQIDSPKFILANRILECNLREFMLSWVFQQLLISTVVIWHFLCNISVNY